MQLRQAIRPRITRTVVYLPAIKTAISMRRTDWLQHSFETVCNNRAENSLYKIERLMIVTFTRKPDGRRLDENSKTVNALPV